MTDELNLDGQGSHSRCRNCSCLHWYIKGSEWPKECYCRAMFMVNEECVNYEPTDNLEFLEYKYEKSL
jgi:hypothetical protein